MGLADLMGHVSVRLGEVVAVSPAPGEGSPPPGSTHADDVVILDLEGRACSGRFPPPSDVQIDLALYRARPEIGSVVVASPRYSVALGSVGRPILPLSHSQSWLALEGQAVWDIDGLVVTRQRGDALAAKMHGRNVCQLPGVGIVHAATSLVGAIGRCDLYEQLARMTALTTSLGAPRLVTASESSAYLDERVSFDPTPSRDPARYYRSFDIPITSVRSFAAAQPVAADELTDVKRQVALACRILDLPGTLVGFFEHVSHRLDRAPGRFVMSPAKRFAHMEPTDQCVVGMAGACEWLDGPLAPAPFRWFHRDILQARPDVRAIVHTHDLYGRAFVLAGRAPRRIWRNGALLAAHEVPIFPVASLVFSPADREACLRLLGDGPVLSILAHGTDYVSDRLEEAAVMAIQREELLRMEHLAGSLGEPRPLGPGVLADLARHAPASADWWASYAADVPGGAAWPP